MLNKEGVYGAIHPENTYNLENEERDRKLNEKEQKMNKGEQVFIDVEDLPDSEALTDVYRQAEFGVADKMKNIDRDKFGFAELVADFFEKIPQKDKEDFLNRSVLFLEEYQKILNSEISEKEALSASQKAFDNIIGRQVLSHDLDSGEYNFSLEKAAYIKVKDKKAPADSYHPQYSSKGRVIDPEESTQAKIKKKKFSFFNRGFKLPWH